MSTQTDNANLKFALGGFATASVVWAGLALTAFNIHTGLTSDTDTADSSIFEQRMSSMESGLAALKDNPFASMSDQAFESKVEESINNIIKRRAQEQAQGAGQATNGPAPAQGTTGFDGELQVSVNDNNDIVYGNPDAKYSIMVYKDFRCTYCKRYVPELNAFVANNDDVNWIYKAFPVLGQASVQLAIAGECVALEEGPESFAQYARAAYQTGDWQSAMNGIALENAQAVKECITTNKYSSRLAEVRQEARELNITGTPASLFRNNVTGKGAFVPGYLQSHQVYEMLNEVKE